MEPGKSVNASASSASRCQAVQRQRPTTPISNQRSLSLSTEAVCVLNASTHTDWTHSKDLTVQNSSLIAVLPSRDSLAAAPCKADSTVQTASATQTCSQGTAVQRMSQRQLQRVRALERQVALTKGIVLLHTTALRNTLRKRFSQWTAVWTAFSEACTLQFLHYSAVFIQKVVRGHLVRARVNAQLERLKRSRALLLGLVKGWKTRAVMKSKRFQTQVVIVKDMMSIAQTPDDPLRSEVVKKLPSMKAKLMRIFYQGYYGAQRDHDRFIEQRTISTPPKDVKPFLKRKSQTVQASKVVWSARSRVLCWNRKVGRNPRQKKRSKQTRPAHSARIECPESVVCSTINLQITKAAETQRITQ